MESKSAVNLYNLSFIGRGIDLFRIQIVNAILSIITLGLYYPWAKVTNLQYLYSQTILEEHPFAFTGTGKEMFKGFVIAVLYLVLGYCIFIYIYTCKNKHFGILFSQVFILFTIPIAIHFSYKFRMSKTLWRGIRFGYTGSWLKLLLLYIKGILLTIITLGFYSAWFTIEIRKYVIGNIKIGNAEFRYNGNGAELLWLNVKGFILTLITFGIYWIWWQKNLFDYYINNLELYNKGKGIMFRSNTTGGAFIGLMLGNFFIVVLTFGLGYSWAVVRTLNFVGNYITPIGNYSFDDLQQTNPENNNATGLNLADFLNLGFVI